MKKNRVFFSMLGLSATLHGLVMIGLPGKEFYRPLPAGQEKTVSILTMIKAGTPTPAKVPSTPTEKKAVEKPVEPQPELPPIQETVQETVNSEDIQEDDKTQKPSSATGHNGEAPEGEAGESKTDEAVPEGWAEEGGPMTDHEYEALLTYIKDFIEKNLVYPPMARRRNVEGIVGVHFEIERNGGLAAIMVDHSSGNSILDNAAVSLMKKMHPPENLTLNRTLALRVNIAYELTE
ncbi:MAG: TonB family protein [Treponema sp.]|jgi:protein TonB|nr:TonB family protein [Treponema sp.]